MKPWLMGFQPSGDWGADFDAVGRLMGIDAENIKRAIDREIMGDVLSLPIQREMSLFGVM